MRYFISFGVLVMCAAVTVTSADVDFSIPPQWNRTSTVRSDAERAARAEAVLGTLWVLSDAGSNGFIVLDGNAIAPQYGAVVAHASALYDRLHGTLDYANVTDVIDANVQIVLQKADELTVTAAVHWGHAAVQAYQAYGDSNMLQKAQDVFDWVVANHQIIDDSGTVPVRNGTYSTSCNGKTAIGGVFASPIEGPLPLDIAVAGTASFMSLAAHLAGFLSTNDTFWNSAAAAGDFLLTHASLPTGNPPSFVRLRAQGKGSCPIGPAAQSVASGWAAEGFARLSKISSGDDQAKWRDAAFGVITTAMKSSTPAWHTASGFISEGGDKASSGTDGLDLYLSKGQYIRSLSEVFGVFGDNDQLRNLTSVYVNIQYESLVNLASDPAGLPYYSETWTGPGKMEFQFNSQISAVYPLTAALAVPPPSVQAASGPPSSNSQSGTQPGNTSSVQTAKTGQHYIVALAVGLPLSGLVILVGALLLWRRASRRKVLASTRSRSLIDEEVGNAELRRTQMYQSGNFTVNNSGPQSQTLNIVLPGTLPGVQWGRSTRKVRSQVHALAYHEDVPPEYSAIDLR